MSGFADTVLIGAKRAGYYALQFLFVGVLKTGQVLKVQQLGGRKCGARKQLEKSHAALGAELHAFFKRGGDSGWQREPAIEHQLKRAEEAEARLFRTDADKEGLSSEYLAKKEAIIAKYAAKRDALGSGK
jgi:hypothetical protein